MTDSFKNQYNYESLTKLAYEIQAVYSELSVEDFLNETINNKYMEKFGIQTKDYAD